MKRYVPIIILLLAVLLSSGCAVYPATPAYGHEPAPRVVTNTPEYLYVIPSFGVYFVPNITAEIFFVNGRWYYNARGNWYWGVNYSGPWTHIEVRHIPRHLRRLPRDYRTKYRTEYYRVPYGHWKKRRNEVPPRGQPSSPPYMEKYKSKVYLHPKDRDVVFHDGNWYRKYKGLWYQGKSSAGPWRYRENKVLPKAVKKLPPEYRKPKQGKPYKQVPWPWLENKYKKKMDRRDW